MTVETLISIENYEAFLEAHPDGLFELVHGEIVEKVPTQEHSVIATKISARLLVFVEDHNIKAHVAVEARFRPQESRHNDRIPDVSVQFTEQPPVSQGAVTGMPDLAVEIKSPTDSIGSIREKAAYYLENGCRMVWLIYPEQRIAEIYQPDEDIQILVMGDSISGGTILPDFSLALANIFPE